MTSDPLRAATIRDVAAAAGVSRAAVSKVIRNAAGVSADMRERVSAAIESLDYRPRTAARAMRGRTFTIGVEIPDFGNQFFTRMLDGAMRALDGTPYQIIIAPAEIDSRRGLRAVESLIDRQVDGVVVVSPRVAPADLERIAHSTPVVMLGRHDRAVGYDCVAGDDSLGVQAALEHLIGLGHRRIAHLTLLEADPAEDSPHGIRLRRYLELMDAAGLTDEIRIIRSDEGQHAAGAAVREAIDTGLDATALFAAHDELAIGALRAAEEEGVELSIVGYDDVLIASHPAIGLTTIHQPGDLMGARAVELLLERIGGRTEPQEVVFPTELIVRSSTRRLTAR